MSHRRCYTPGRKLLFSLLAVGLGLGVLFGCSMSASEENRLPDSTFTKVVTELHLLKARRARTDSVPRSLRDSIFARYEVRPAAFDATLRYYSRHPEAFGSLYQAVIDTLKAVQRVEEDRSIPDSLRDRRGEDADQPARRYEN